MLFTAETFVEFPDYYVTGPTSESGQGDRRESPHPSMRGASGYSSTTERNGCVQGDAALPANYKAHALPDSRVLLREMSNTHHRYSIR